MTSAVNVISCQERTVWSLHVLSSVQIMKTEFVPKLVATVTVCCASYVVLAASDKIITVKTLASIGYFDALVCRENFMRNHTNRITNWSCNAFGRRRGEVVSLFL